MKINIVTVNSGWILQKISERVAAANPDVFQISSRPVGNVDANFYIDMLNCYRNKSPILDVGFFTHLHEDSADFMQSHWLSLDHIVHMCTRYKKAFQQFYPAEKMSVLYPGQVDEQFSPRKPLIGIFQRGFHEGKGFDFMKSIAHYDILKNFKFMFVGSDWEEVADIFNNNSIETRCHESEDYSEYPELYHKIDYLLIPSLWEGGPMSLIEAYATGTPIISSDVGWVNTDFEVDYLYEANNGEQLRKTLEKIYEPIYNRRQKVAAINYKTYGDKITKIVKGLK